MNIFKKTLAVAVVALSTGFIGSVAVAEEAAAVAQESAANPSQAVVTHIEAALSFLEGKGDLSNAQPHIKVALETARDIKGNPAAIKKAWDSLVNGRTEVKRGNPDNAIKSLHEAVVLYKAL